MELESQIDSLESAARVARADLAERWKDLNGAGFSEIVDDYLHTFSKTRGYCREGRALEEEERQYKAQFDACVAKRNRNASSIAENVDSLNTTLAGFR